MPEIKARSGSPTALLFFATGFVVGTIAIGGVYGQSTGVSLFVDAPVYLNSHP